MKKVINVIIAELIITLIGAILALLVINEGCIVSDLFFIPLIALGTFAVQAMALEHFK